MRLAPMLGPALLALALEGAIASDLPVTPDADVPARPDRSPALPTPDDLGLNAPLVEVDRFSDAAGTLLRRSRDASLPRPNQPFSLDDPRFALAVAGPGGAAARCYNLDVRPATPRRYYVFYDALNNYRLGQFPVIEAVPGDAGYTDLWDIWKIVTPDDFRETNWVRDAATVERLLADSSSGYAGASTGVFLNAPVVPEGTTAGSKAESRPGKATMLYAWYKGRRAPFLYFEGSLKLQDGRVPVATLTLAERERSWPPKGPMTAAAWPKLPAYSPLARVVDARGKAAVVGTIDCPIVGTGAD